MSGWDNAPAYGGGGHWFTNLLAVLVLAATCALALLLTARALS